MFKIYPSIFGPTEFIGVKGNHVNNLINRMQLINIKPILFLVLHKTTHSTQRNFNYVERYCKM